MTKRYFVEITQNNNTFKVGMAKELVKVNQFKQSWKRISGRKIARDLNRGELVIN